MKKITKRIVAFLLVILFFVLGISLFFVSSEDRKDVTSAKRLNLWTNYYLSDDSQRQEEIDFAMRMNVNSALFDTIYILTGEEGEEERDRILSWPRENNHTTILILEPKRPTY